MAIAVIWRIRVIGQWVAAQERVQLAVAEMIGLIQIDTQPAERFDRCPERGMQRFVIQGILLLQTLLSTMPGKHGTTRNNTEGRDGRCSPP